VAATGQTPSRVRLRTAPTATPSAAAPITIHRPTARWRCSHSSRTRLRRLSRCGLRLCHLHRLLHQQIHHGHPCQPSPPAASTSTTVAAGGPVQTAAPARAMSRSASSSAAARSRRAMQRIHPCHRRRFRPCHRRLHHSCLPRSLCRGRRLHHQRWWRHPRRHGLRGSPTAPGCCCPPWKHQCISVKLSQSWWAMIARRLITCSGRSTSPRAQDHRACHPLARPSHHRHHRRLPSMTTTPIPRLLPSPRRRQLPRRPSPSPSPSPT